MGQVPRQPQREARAVSLIELLVVIAIILVVASLVFAVLSPAKREARRIACTSNLRQLGLATNLYRVDWDDKKPIDNILRRPLKRLAWELLKPYSKNEEVFACSEDPRNDRVGYVYRAFIRNPRQMKFRVPLGLDSTSMMAFCIYHLKLERQDTPLGPLDNPIFGKDNHYEGAFQYLRNDGSVDRVNAKAVDTYLSNGTGWHLIGSEPPGGTYFIRTERFPGEPWPPEFQE